MKILEVFEENTNKSVLKTDKKEKLIKIDENNKKKTAQRNLDDDDDEPEKEKKVKLDKICNFDFKLQFIKRDRSDDLDLQGRAASQAIKDLCPSIQTSCCTESDLKSLFDQAQIGLVTNFVENTNYFQKMINVIKDLNEEKIDKIISAGNENLKECIKNDPKDFKNLLKETAESTEILRESYLKYATTSWEEVYRIQCGICDINFSKYLKFKKSDEIPYKITVEGNSEVFKFYSNLNDYKPFFRLEQIYKVLNCVHFKKGGGIDLKKKIYPEEYEDLLKSKNKVGLSQNKKTRDFFLDNYVPGGFRDIFFRRFVFLLVNSMSNTSRFQEEKVLAFWSPLDVQDISNKDFKVGNVLIEINDKQGYNSGKIKIGSAKNCEYVKELNSTIDYYRKAKDDILFVEMKGTVVAIFLFIQMIILF